MKKQFARIKALIIFCLALWLVFLVCLVAPSIIGSTPEALMVLTVVSSFLGAVTLVLILLILLWPITHPDKNSALVGKPVNKILGRTLAVLLASCLVVGTYASIHSLGASPVEGDKFVWQNNASAAGIATLFLMLVLSTLQHDVYWYSRQRKIKLDEFQLRERYEVLEISYKVGSLLVILAAYWLSSNIHQVAAYVNDNTNPGSDIIAWAFFNVGLTLFSLPLIVAAFKKKQPGSR